MFRLYTDPTPQASPLRVAHNVDYLKRKYIRQRTNKQSGPINDLFFVFCFFFLACVLIKIAQERNKRNVRIFVEERVVAALFDSAADYFYYFRVPAC